MSAVEFERTFSMATFEALRLIRQERAEHPGVAALEIVEIIRQVRANNANHDFEAALALDALVVDDVVTVDTIEFYRLCIEACVFAHRPLWVKTIPYGRKSFVQKLGRDEAQCFEASGLMDDPPTETIISWWDSISGRTRSQSDLEKMRQARAAERLSLDYEQARLDKLGIDRRAVWMSIDDNWAGYDILSYDLGPTGITSRMIEVKSTIASPLRYFLSRNEWNVCRKVGGAYHIHIWDMTTGKLFIRTGADIAEHIPEERGAGKWATLEIRVGAESAITKNV